MFLTLLGGFLFGWLVGGAAAAVAATIGATGLFLIARTSIGDALLHRAGSRVQRLAAGFREDAFSYLLFLRFLPVVPFWITNLASALFGVPLKTFFLATQIGVIPATYAFAVAGSGLDSVIDAQSRAREACLAAGGTDCAFDFQREEPADAADHRGPRGARALGVWSRCWLSGSMAAGSRASPRTEPTHEGQPVARR